MVGRSLPRRDEEMVRQIGDWNRSTEHLRFELALDVMFRG